MKVGGLFLAPKKGDISIEITMSRKASQLLGGANPIQRSFTLPGEIDLRVVVMFKKITPTSPIYPRIVGQAKLHPLGVSPATAPGDDAE
ncbi:MAG: hypothetical protein ABIQ44_08765 [Chloroflexia bacterium]